MYDLDHVSWVGYVQYRSCINISQRQVRIYKMIQIVICPVYGRFHYFLYIARDGKNLNLPLERDLACR